jgi:hypothetical protein
MFTIKNKKYALTHNHPDLHLKLSTSRHIFLNAGNFRDDLHTAKDRYFADVEIRPDLLERLVEGYNRDGFLGPEVLTPVLD